VACEMSSPHRRKFRKENRRETRGIDIWHDYGQVKFSGRDQNVEKDSEGQDGEGEVTTYEDATNLKGRRRTLKPLYMIFAKEDNGENSSSVREFGYRERGGVSPYTPWLSLKK